MANTIFAQDEVIQGTDQGVPYKFRATKDGVEGSGSVYGPGIDLLQNNQKVFLKKYVDPAPRSPWFNDFVSYQKKIQDKIEQSSSAKQLIARIHRYFQDDRRRFWQAIEYVENSKDLKKYLESSDTTWEQRMMFAKVFMFAMKVLHDELHMVHGDLKPANLLLIPLNGGGYSVKLIDFDRPILLDEGEVPWKSEGYIGSPGYYSPEEADANIAETLHRMLEPNSDDRPTADEVYQIFFRSGEIRPASRVENSSSQVPEPAPRTDSEGSRGMAAQPSGWDAPKSSVETMSLKGAADIVFLIDSTGSMGPCINALKEHIHSFIDALVRGDESRNISPVENWRARVVGYRDFDDCNKSDKAAKNYRKFGGGGWFLSNPFTRDENVLHDQLNKLRPFAGGQDPKESLLDALMLVLKSGFLPSGSQDASETDSGVSWRRNGAGRIVIVFTDAGYHETMSYSSDTTRFEEGSLYPIDLRGANLDDLQNAMESGHFKLYVFAPALRDYDELSDLTNVLLMQSDGEGLANSVSDSRIEQLIDDIVKGVSRSSSDFKEISF